jgi:transcriptional regulator with XRE-family HTH domain
VALTVAQARRLRHLRGIRQDLARRLGVAPVRLIDEAALTALAIAPVENLAGVLARAEDETGLLAAHGGDLLAAARQIDG